jgi:hypothetical protein
MRRVVGGHRENDGRLTIQRRDETSITYVPISWAPSRRTEARLAKPGRWVTRPYNLGVADPSVSQGWQPDPLGHHGERWMSNGQATSLVRDGQQEGRDPVPGWSDPPRRQLHPLPSEGSVRSEDSIDDISTVSAAPLVDSPQAARSFGRFISGRSPGSRALRIVLASLSLLLLNVRLCLNEGYPPVTSQEVIGTVVGTFDPRSPITGVSGNPVPSDHLSAVWPYEVTYAVDHHSHRLLARSTSFVLPDQRVIVAYGPHDPSRAHVVSDYTNQLHMNWVLFAGLLLGEVALIAAGLTFRRHRRHDRKQRWRPTNH